MILALLANMAPPPSAGALRFEISVPLRGMYCLAQEETVVVCTSREELDSVLSRFGIGQDGDFAVDFTARVVLVAFLGRKATAGYSVEPVGAYEFYSNDQDLDPWKPLESLLKEDGVNPEDIGPDPDWHAGENLTSLFMAHLVVLQEKCPPKWAMIPQVITSPWIMIEVKVSYTGYTMDRLYLKVLSCEEWQ